jgi:peptidoglycan/LPS O-acetylase OafA/YrhL
MDSSGKDKSRLIGLDALRGIAILLVVIFHYLHDRILGGITNVIVGPFGLGGVTLFFLLSGFLIERHLARDGNLIRYFSRRLFRILPAYFICLAVILAIHVFTHTDRSWTPREIAINALLAQDVLGAPLMLGVIWTLLIEVKFYALAPFVKRAGPLALLLAPYLTIALNGAVFAARGEASNFLTYVTFCFLGMQFGPWNRGELPSYALVAVTAVAAAATYIFGTYYALGLTIFVIVNAAILAAALKRPIAVPVLPFFGNVSYSWYLYHAAVGYPLIAAVTAKTGSPFIAITLAAITGMLAAWISYAFIERPGITLGLRCETFLRLPPPRTGASVKREQQTV